MEMLLKEYPVNRLHECKPFLATKSNLLFCKTCARYQGSNSKQEINIHTRYYRSSNNNAKPYVRIDHESNLSQMIKKQHENRFFNENSFHLEIRTKIIDFIFKMHSKFDKDEEIFHKSVVFMDSILSRNKIPVNKVEVVVLLCLHIASKFNESFSLYDPSKSYFKYAQKNYSFKEIIDIEKQLIAVLDFKLDVQSPYHFLNFFNSKGIISNGDIHSLINLYTPIIDQSTPNGSIKNIQNIELPQIEFSLKSLKSNTSTKLKIFEKDLIIISDLYKNIFNSKSFDYILFIENIVNNQISKIEDSEIFEELQICYQDPCWKMFIDFIYLQISRENDVSKGDMFLAKLAGKNNHEDIISFIKDKNNLTQKKNIFSFETLPSFTTLNENISNQSNPKNKKIEKITSIVLTNQNLNNSKNITKPFSSQKNLNKNHFEMNDSSLIELNLEDFSFPTNILKTSSSYEVILRLLNCLRFNQEFLPLGLIEVCCSNFEIIYEILLNASLEVYSLNKFTSVAVAVSILYLTRKLMNLSDVWHMDLVNLTGLTEQDIHGCVDHFLQVPSLYNLINKMSKDFDENLNETIIKNKKIISFKNILKMYKNKSRKIIQDFKKFQFYLKINAVTDIINLKLKSKIHFKNLNTKIMKKEENKENFIY